MFTKSEPKSAITERGPALTLGMVIVALIFMLVCIFSLIWINLKNKASPPPQPEIPLTGSLPEALPIHLSSVYLPVINSENLPVPVSVSAPVWIVTNIRNLGYETGGQRYDLATFTQRDNQETAQGYCLNRGWAVPYLGTEYLLNAEGIFVPVQENQDQPFQRFSKIQ